MTETTGILIHLAVAALLFVVGVHNVIDWRRKRLALKQLSKRKAKPTRGPDGRWRAQGHLRSRLLLAWSRLRPRRTSAEIQRRILVGEDRSQSRARSEPPGRATRAVVASAHRVGVRTPKADIARQVAKISRLKDRSQFLNDVHSLRNRRLNLRLNLKP
jgi:hypothetical protein